MAFSKSFITGTLKEQGISNIKVIYRDFLLPGIPELAIQSSILIGNIVEKVPALNMMA